MGVCVCVKDEYQSMLMTGREILYRKHIASIRAVSAATVYINSLDEYVTKQTLELSTRRGKYVYVSNSSAVVASVNVHGLERESATRGLCRISPINFGGTLDLLMNSVVPTKPRGINITA